MTVYIYIYMTISIDNYIYFGNWGAGTALWLFSFQVTFSGGRTDAESLFHATWIPQCPANFRQSPHVFAARCSWRHDAHTKNGSQGQSENGVTRWSLFFLFCCTTTVNSSVTGQALCSGHGQLCASTRGSERNSTMRKVGGWCVRQHDKQM